MEKERYALHSRTYEALNKLEQSEWFNKVGQLITTNTIVSVTSWKEAIRYRKMRKWGRIRLEAANMISDAVNKVSINRYNYWNDIVFEIDRAFDPIIDRQVLPIMEKYKLPDVFKHAVSWDLGHFLIECEYEDIYPNGFFRNLAYWYMQGHFPCGWTCNFSEWKKDKSNGKLIVY